MERDELIQSIAGKSPHLRHKLEKLSNETLEIIWKEFRLVKEQNPNTIIDDVDTPGGKSLIIKLSVTINTLPYVVEVG